MSQSHKQPLNTNLRPHTHDGCGDFLKKNFTMLLLKVLFGSQHAGPSTRETPRQQQQYPPMSSTQPAPPKQRTTTYILPAILQARLAGSLSRSGAPPQETRATGGGRRTPENRTSPRPAHPPRIGRAKRGSQLRNALFLLISFPSCKHDFDSRRISLIRYSSFYVCMYVKLFNRSETEKPKNRNEQPRER